MQTHCILLLSAHPLLSEGLVRLLRDKEEVVLIGPLPLEGFRCADLPQHAPDLVLVAGQDADDPGASALLLELLQAFPDLPIAHIGLSGGNTVRVYTSRTLPASSADLLTMIRSLPVRNTGQDKASPEP